MHAVRDVSFQVERGEIFSIIGPNGAGKTTVLKTISGAMEPQKGAVIYGQEIQGRDPDVVARPAGDAHDRDLPRDRARHDVEARRHSSRRTLPRAVAAPGYRRAWSAKLQPSFAD